MTQRLPKSVLDVVTFTIASGQTVSGSADTLPFLDLTNYVLVGIEFPAAMTGTGVTFQVSNDSGVYDTYGALKTAPSTYVPVYQGAGVVTITKQNSTLVLLGTTYRSLDGMGKYLQVVSSGSEASARTFKAYLVPRS